MLDSSVALTWCLVQQFNVPSLELFYRVEAEGAVVPAIWHLEVGNILGLKRRSGHLDESEMDVSIRLLHGLNLETDLPAGYASISEVLQSMKRFRLTAYDAGYVELASRRSLPLATFDKEMRETARQHGIPLANTL